MKLHRKLARRFGYELIKRRKHPTSNTHIINLVNAYKIDLVLDVGANLGQFGKTLRQEGYGGEIHSFEPVSATYGLLEKASHADKQWFVHHCAMGNECGNSTINIAGSPDLSSLLMPNKFGKEKYKKIETLRKENIKISTIDTFLEQQITDLDNRRIFLKMDTQGYDLNVFKGSSNTLKYIVCILSEISLIPIYFGMPHYLDALKNYEEQGFIITGLYPISRKDNLSVVEMDCMLLNSNLQYECS